MKAIFKITSKCVKTFDRNTEGFEFIQEVSGEEEMYKLINELEDQDFFPHEDGMVFSASGSEVFDPEYPHLFYFGDYHYELVDTDDLNESSDPNFLKALNK